MMKADELHRDEQDGSVQTEVMVSQNAIMPVSR
jgi:hypothetical protein